MPEYAGGWMRTGNAQVQPSVFYAKFRKETWICDKNEKREYSFSVKQVNKKNKMESSSRDEKGEAVMSMNIEQLLKDMTLEEKASCAPAMILAHEDGGAPGHPGGRMMCDGPNGLRKQGGKVTWVSTRVSSGLLPHVPPRWRPHLTWTWPPSGRCWATRCQAENIAQAGTGNEHQAFSLAARNFGSITRKIPMYLPRWETYIEGIQSRKSRCQRGSDATNNPGDPDERGFRGG